MQKPTCQAGIIHEYYHTGQPLCLYVNKCAQVSPPNCLVSSSLCMRPVMQLPFIVRLLISTLLPSTSNCCTWLAHVENLRSLTQIGSMSCSEVFLKPLSALNLSNLQSLKISLALLPRVTAIVRDLSQESAGSQARAHALPPKCSSCDEGLGPRPLSKCCSPVCSPQHPGVPQLILQEISLGKFHSGLQTQRPSSCGEGDLSPPGFLPRGTRLSRTPR